MGGEAKGTNVIFQYSVKPCENLKKCLGNNKQDEFEGTDVSLTRSLFYKTFYRSQTMGHILEHGLRFIAYTALEPVWEH